MWVLVIKHLGYQELLERQKAFQELLERQKHRNHHHHHLPHSNYTHLGKQVREEKNKNQCSVHFKGKELFFLTLIE